MMNLTQIKEVVARVIRDTVGQMEPLTGQHLEEDLLQLAGNRRFFMITSDTVVALLWKKIREDEGLTHFLLNVSCAVRLELSLESENGWVLLCGHLADTYGLTSNTFTQSDPELAGQLINPASLLRLFTESTWLVTLILIQHSLPVIAMRAKGD